MGRVGQGTGRILAIYVPNPHRSRKSYGRKSWRKKRSFEWKKHARLLILEPGLVELERARVLGHRTDDVVGRSLRNLGVDL